MKAPESISWLRRTITVLPLLDRRVSWLKVRQLDHSHSTLNALQVRLASHWVNGDSVSLDPEVFRALPECNMGGDGEDTVTVMSFLKRRVERS